MDRPLARKNIATGLLVTVIMIVVFCLTFVAAFLYTG
jgi:hypothetical protein